MTDNPADRRLDPAAKRVVINTKVAHVARVYNYWLGGKDNYAADRKAAEAAMVAVPSLPEGARANRAFLGRAVRFLAAEAGIRQFLDIGTGIPAADNTHEVAQRVAPEARVVYVDNDPIVFSQARALLASGPQGATSYVNADLRDVDTVLREAAQTLDFSKPVGLTLVAILHCIPDEDDPHGIVASLAGAVCPGSYLAISHTASDIDPAAIERFAASLNRMLAQRITPRSKAQISGFFRGLEMVPPGVVAVPKWRPDSEAEAAAVSHLWAGVGRKS